MLVAAGIAFAAVDPPFDALDRLMPFGPPALLE